jgi:hypothetical protein
MPTTEEKKQKEKKVAAKKEKVATPHWQMLVKIFFDFCNDKKGDEPSFGGMETRNMKEIVKELQRRAEKRNIVWTEEVAVSRWSNFLKFSYTDYWLSNNWTLFNLNRQKDKVFYKIAEQIKIDNGQQSIIQSSTGYSSGSQNGQWRNQREEQANVIDNLFGKVTEHFTKSAD